jgi:hypothetical protein
MRKEGRKKKRNADGSETERKDGRTESMRKRKDRKN